MKKRDTLFVFYLTTDHRPLTTSFIRVNNLVRGYNARQQFQVTDFKAIQYYCAALPARPYKPRDKAKVEAGVWVTRWILARAAKGRVLLAR